MGLTPSKFDQPLAKQPDPIAIVDQRFCCPQEVTLHLKEKMFSWSGDDFQIADPNTGQSWFKIKGKAFSRRENKTMYDAFETPVLSIKEFVPFSRRLLIACFPFCHNFLEATFRFYLGEKAEQELFKVVAKNSLTNARAYTTVTDRVSNKQRQITLKGNISSKQACIYLGDPKTGIPIAKISRPSTARSAFFGKQDYYLTVAPNVDISFCVAFCICWDEMKRD